jgi:thymidylate synthase
MRVVNGKLIVETSWRSRDLFRAWSANVYAILELIKSYLDKYWPSMKIGEYMDFSNSLHVYGDNFSHVHDFFDRLRTIQLKNDLKGYYE